MVFYRFQSRADFLEVSVQAAWQRTTVEENCSYDGDLGAKEEKVTGKRDAFPGHGPNNLLVTRHHLQIASHELISGLIHWHTVLL